MCPSLQKSMCRHKREQKEEEKNSEHNKKKICLSIPNVGLPLGTHVLESKSRRSSHPVPADKRAVVELCGEQENTSCG